jgi:PAS domain-containing protein
MMPVMEPSPFRARLGRWRALVGGVRCQPRLWLPLAVWPLAVLAFALVRDVLFPRCGRLVVITEAALLLTALASLSLFAALVLRFYRHLRAARHMLFEGDYEGALEFTHHCPALGEGLGFQGVLSRLLAFDRRRAERVAAATRLFDSFLREVPLPLFVVLLEDDVVRFSRTLCRLLDITDDKFPLDFLLFPAPNRQLANVLVQLATGRRSSLDLTVSLHLPVAHKSQALPFRLVAVQNDQGVIIYVLGIAQLPAATAEAPPAPAPPPAGGSEGTPDA